MIIKTENVGWLSKTVPVKGKIPQELLNRLAYIGHHYRVKCCFGHHVCDICFSDDGEYYGSPELVKKFNFSHWGNGELWIKGKNKVWIAPTMIVHYIYYHMYLPPPEFLEDLKNLAEEDAKYFCQLEKERPLYIESL